MVVGAEGASVHLEGALVHLEGALVHLEGASVHLEGGEELQNEDRMINSCAVIVYIILLLTR